MKKVFSFMALAGLIVLVASCAHCSGKGKGNPVLSAGCYSIVIPDEATAPERTAALELSIYLGQLTGESLAIVPESHQKTCHAIYVGKCKKSEQIASIDYEKLGFDGIRMVSKDGDLVLTGDKRGVLYAVFTFLQKYADCRWFAEDCIVIPEKKGFRIPEIDVEYVPALEYRHNSYYCARNTRFAVANKDNGQNIPPEWGGRVIYKGFVHTFLDLVPLKVYGKTHPEYYAEVEGKRVLRPHQTQLCLTNPEVLEIVIKEVKRRLREVPDAIVSVSQSDNNNYYCRCKNCAAIAAYEESEAGPMIHFVNKVARAIKDEFPKAAIDTLAYGYTRKPPKYVKADPNVVVRLCSIECCFSHPFEGDTGPNAKFARDLIEWGNHCQRLYIWNYVINFKHCLLPFPNFHTLMPDIKFLIKHNAASVFEQANNFCRGGEFEHLRSYLALNCLWDQDFDVQQGIREFTDAYYGAAASHIRGYIDMMTEHVKNRKNVHMRIYGIPEQHFDDKALMDRALNFFVEAEKAVADDPVRLARVQGAKLPVMYVRLCLYMDEEPVRSAMLQEFETIARRYENFRVAERSSRTLEQWLSEMRGPKPAPDKKKEWWQIPY